MNQTENLDHYTISEPNWTFGPFYHWWTKLNIWIILPSVIQTEHLDHSTISEQNWKYGPLYHQWTKLNIWTILPLVNQTIDQTEHLDQCNISKHNCKQWTKLNIWTILPLVNYTEHSNYSTICEPNWTFWPFQYQRYTFKFPGHTIFFKTIRLFQEESIR